MIPQDVRKKRDTLAAAECQVRWCDDHELDDENMEGVSPGETLNGFGWFVVGTTIGGNAIVVGEADPGVYYADHEWYTGDSIDYQDLQNGGEWVSVELTEPNVRRSLFPLAATIDDFVAKASDIDDLLDEID